MKMNSKYAPRFLLLAVAFVLIVSAIIVASTRPTRRPGTASDADRPDLRIVVMDPLSDKLACDCVEGYAQRKYDMLGAFLEEQLNRPVLIAYGETLAEIVRSNPDRIDLIIGKNSVVLFDTARTKTNVRPIARLTDGTGTTNLTGLFVVRNDDRAKSIAELEDYKIMFGPKWETEKNQAATEALKAKGISLPEQIRTEASCSGAALAVVENKADVAVISSYALALLEGCDTIDKGSLRVVGKTAGVPFITVFATNAVTAEVEEAIVNALLSVKDNETLLAQMESKAGFVTVCAKQAECKVTNKASAMEWTDWRGPNRDAVSPHVPDKLPEKPIFLWRQPCTGVGLSGIAATAKYVIITDKAKDAETDKDYKWDIFRCLDSDTGKEIWSIKYPAAGDMDFTNSPRANPVIHDGLAYLLGAFGDLHCVELETGKIRWKKNIVKEFKAELAAWGMSSSPLIVDDKLIVNPGASNASIVALDRRTGKVIWKTPGEPAAYSSFILGIFGGVRQIVGYDAISIGGWEPKTGKRLWQLLPEEESDFNVPTPINVRGRLLVCTENNGTRLYDFDRNGRIRPEPLAQTIDLAPDTSTPVVIGDLVFGCFSGLFCLDLNDNLKTLYTADDDAFYDYAALIAGNDRVLLTTVGAELILLKADANHFTLLSRLRLFDDESIEVWSHPGLVAKRLYIRSQTEICCLLLDN